MRILIIALLLCGITLAADEASEEAPPSDLAVENTELKAKVKGLKREVKSWERKERNLNRQKSKQDAKEMSLEKRMLYVKNKEVGIISKAKKLVKENKKREYRRLKAVRAKNRKKYGIK